MDFLYHNELSKLTIVCPQDHYKPMTFSEVFRWVFDSIDDDRNFKPRFFLVPKANLENKDDIEKCNMLALSMFVKENCAVDRFNALKEDTGKIIYKRFGSKIAKGFINEDDGVNERPNFYGHFNHHPYQIIDYVNRFKIISSL